MKKAKGFTLVELLVVIGIIALLISILLPSLNRVRWQASLTKCAAQMRDLVSAVQMYANENRGWLPPSYRNYSTMNKASTASYGDFYGGDNNVAWIWTLQYNSGSSLADPKDPGALLGRLYKTGHIRSKSAVAAYGGPLQCPNASLDNTKAYMSNYYFNPHLAMRTCPTVPGGYYAEFWWKKITNYGRYPAGPTLVHSYSATPDTKNLPQFRHALITDPIYDFVNNTHARGNTRAWNFAYADGSVQSFTTDKWADRATGKWQRLLDLSNALQHAADGGQVNFASGTWVNNLYNAIPLDPP